eukprot:scaffold11049_cov54-Cylindrotheca_fusiformis.AAC.1
MVSRDEGTALSFKRVCFKVHNNQKERTREEDIWLLCALTAGIPPSARLYIRVGIPKRGHKSFEEGVGEHLLLDISNGGERGRNPGSFGTFVRRELNMNR